MELWASCFAADSLAPAASALVTTLTCYTCGSSGNLYAQCPLRRQSGGGPCIPPRFDPPPVPTGVVPATAPASRAQPRPPSGGQEQCTIFNDKGRCFRGPRCPYTHSCLFCGGPHAKRVCPPLRTRPGASNLNPTTAPFNAMLRRTCVHSSATTASFSATSRYLPTLSVGSTPHA